MNEHSPVAAPAKADDTRIVSYYQRIRLYPRISAAEFKACILIATVGGLVAGMFGVVHDLWTYSIGPEYFTKVKFNAFWFANLGLGNREFAGTIGFLAAGSAGFFVTWFLARRLNTGILKPGALRIVATSYLFIAFCVLLAEILGYGYGLWRGPKADYAAWYWAIEKYRVEDVWNFVRVAYIHNSAYLGGGIGLLLALWRMRPPQEPRP
jgi:hypothetical protein